MKTVIARFALLAAALCIVGVGSARAELTAEPVLGFAGIQTLNPNYPVGKAQPQNGIAVQTVVYDNTASAANFGFSSTDLTARFGDQLLTTSPGLLSAQTFGVYNSSSSAGTLLTAVVGIYIYDTATSTLLGSYTVNATFGTGLPPGYYSLLTITNLEPLNILIPVTDIIVIQRVISFTGTPTRLGIVSMDPPTVGTSPTSMYIQASTVNGGVAGFYTIAAGPANPAYQLVLDTQTVGVAPTTWGTLKGLYR